MSVPSLIASDKVVLPSSLTVNWKSAKWNRLSLMRKKWHTETAKPTWIPHNWQNFLLTFPFTVHENQLQCNTHKHTHTYLTIPKNVTDKWCKEHWLHIATVYIFVSKSADILLSRTKEEQKWVMNSRQAQECSHLHKIDFTCSLITNETCFTVKVVHTTWSTVRIIIKTWLLMQDRTYLYRTVPTCSLSFAQKHVKVAGWSKQEVGGKNLNLNYHETKFFSSNVRLVLQLLQHLHHKMKIKYM